MKSRPVQISLDEALLQRIDSDAEAREKGRSAFIRAAVELYLAAKRRRSIDVAIAKAYAGKADELLAEVEGLLGARAWPQK